MFTNVLPFFIFLFYFYLVSLIDTNRIKNSKIILLFSLFVLVIFAGGRWSSWQVGYDTSVFDYDTYQQIFNTKLSIKHFFHDFINADLSIRTIEIGYVLYSTLCRHLLGNQYNIYLLLTSFFTIYIFYKGLKKNKIQSGVLYILFFYAARLYLQYNFILMRQAIAMVIIWYAFHYLFNEKKSKYILFVCFASLFHFSAIIALLALLLRLKIEIKKNIYWLTIFVLFTINICGLGDSLIITTLNSILSYIGGGSDIADRFFKYFQDPEQVRSLNILVFVEAMPLIYICERYKQRIQESIQGNFFYNMFYLFLFLLVLTMNFGFLTRMCQYFMYSYFAIFNYFIIYSTYKERHIILSLFSLYLLIYASRYIMIWFYNTPYTFFLFN